MRDAEFRMPYCLDNGELVIEWSMVNTCSFTYLLERRVLFATRSKYVHTERSGTAFQVPTG